MSYSRILFLVGLPFLALGFALMSSYTPPAAIGQDNSAGSLYLPMIAGPFPTPTPTPTLTPTPTRTPSPTRTPTATPTQRPSATGALLRAHTVCTDAPAKTAGPRSPSGTRTSGWRYAIRWDGMTGRLTKTFERSAAGALSKPRSTHASPAGRRIGSQPRSRRRSRHPVSRQGG